MCYLHLGVDISSTKASPRRGGEAEMRLTKDGNGPPQRRPPQEGEASAVRERAGQPHVQPSTKASPGRGGERDLEPDHLQALTLNEGLPRKGRRG